MSTLVILPVYDRNAIIQDALNRITAMIPEADILIIDDDSETPVWEDFTPRDSIRCVRHSNSMGYGGCLITAIDFIADNDYSQIFLADVSEKNAAAVIRKMITELGDNDIVNCSRKAKGITNDEEYSVYSTANAITTRINSVTGLDITDIFSPFKGFKREVFDKIIIEEFDEAALLQLWVQAAHYKLAIKEIFCPEIANPEIDDVSQIENDDEYYLTFIDGEILLYPIE